MRARALFCALILLAIGFGRQRDVAADEDVPYPDALLWGPLPLEAGTIWDLVTDAPGSTATRAVGTVGLLVNRPRTLVYGVDLVTGQSLGDVEIPTSVHGIHIVGRYAWIKEFQELVVRDLDSELDLCDRFDRGRQPDGTGHWFGTLGTFLLLQETDLEHGGHIVRESLLDMRDLTRPRFPPHNGSVHTALFPDSLIGHFGDRARGTVSTIFGLRAGRVIGTVPLVDNTSIGGWDPEHGLLFLSRRGRLRIHDVATGSDRLSVALPPGVDSVRPWARSGSTTFECGAPRGHVIDATLDLGGGRYLVSSGWTVLLVDVEQGIVGRFDKLRAELVPGGLIPFTRHKARGVLDVAEAQILWERPARPHAAGPYWMPPSVGFVRSAGRRRGDDDILFWLAEQDGALETYTGFPGCEIKVLLPTPLVLALRRDDLPRAEAPWVLCAYDPARLPRTTPTPEVDVGFTDLSLAARMTGLARPPSGGEDPFAAYVGEHRYAGTEVPVVVELPRAYADLLQGCNVTLGVSAGTLGTDRFVLEGRGTLETTWRLPSEPGHAVLTVSFEGKSVEIGIEVEPLEPLLVIPVRASAGPPAEALIANLMPDEIQEIDLSFDVRRLSVDWTWHRALRGASLEGGLTGLTFAPGQCVPLGYALAPTDPILWDRQAVLRVHYVFQGKVFEREWDLLTYGAPHLDFDCDDVIDDLDLSPGVVPEEPAWSDRLFPGQQRITAQLNAYGLAGWVEVYDYEYLAGKCVLDWTDRNDRVGARENTRASRMTLETIREAFAKAYEDRVIASITRAVSRFGERSHDLDAEINWRMGQCDKLHPTRYEINYDILTEIYDVELKNQNPVCATDRDRRSFHQALVPVRVRGGLDQAVIVQMKVRGSRTRSTSEDDYSIPSFAYRWYAHADLLDDTNRPLFPQEVALGLARGERLYEMTMSLPASAVPSDTMLYLLVVPLRVERRGEQTYTLALKPREFNTTGVQRVIYVSQDVGEMETIAWDVAGLGHMGASIPPVPRISEGGGDDGGAERFTLPSGMIRAVEGAEGDVDYEVTTLEKIVDAAVRTLPGLTQNARGCVKSVKEYVKEQSVTVDTPEDIPDEGVWVPLKRAEFLKMALVGVKVGTILGTDGKTAAVAFSEGDEVLGSLYAIRTGVGLTEQAVKLSEIRFVKFRMGGASRLTKVSKVLGSKGGQAALSAAVGVVDIGIIAVEMSRTDDPIQQQHCAEAIASTALDTGVSVLGAVFPAVAAADAVMQIEIILFQEFSDNEMAKRIATSPGRVVTFTFQFFWGSVPSEYAETAYETAWTTVTEWVGAERELGILSVFVEPEPGAAPVSGGRTLEEIAQGWAASMTWDQGLATSTVTVMGTRETSTTRAVVSYEVVRTRDILQRRKRQINTDRLEITYENSGTAEQPRWAQLSQEVVSRESSEEEMP